MTDRPGVVYAATTIHVGLPGHASPYTLAYVDFDGGRVLAPVDGRVTVGEHVELVEDPASASGIVATHGGHA